MFELLIIILILYAGTIAISQVIIPKDHNTVWSLVEGRTFLEVTVGWRQLIES